MRSVVALVAMLALVAGCAPTATSSGTPTARDGLGDAPSSAPSATVEPAHVKESGFLTPSRNIGCYLTTDNVRCDIGAKSWSPPPKPADCQLDYGFGVTLATKAQFICAGDSVLGQPEVPTLGYGEAMQAGDLRCDSVEAFLRCENAATQHGFTLSREQYDLW